MSRCPADGSTLEDNAYESVRFHACATCHGLWFTEAALRRAPGAGVESPFAGHARPRAAAKTKGTPVRRACPDCAGTELKARKVEGVEVDVCPGCHGVWVDAGELDAVLRWKRGRGGKAGSRLPGAVLGGAAGVAGAAAVVAAQDPSLMQRVGNVAESAGEVLEVGWGVLEIVGAVLELLSAFSD